MALTLKGVEKNHCSETNCSNLKYFSELSGIASVLQTQSLMV